ATSMRLRMTEDAADAVASCGIIDNGFATFVLVLADRANCIAHHRAQGLQALHLVHRVAPSVVTI
ncbi:hypothetical protein AAGG42_22915, partial [Stenotrophomonas maltophilia]|uniref:hypothetical protein n=1 Tax=Stenotrophomonas maltophilia TaxID=40324 RepID=UPI0031450E6E